MDACALYPTVMRELLLGMAAAGAYVPLWSDRITEEWAGVAARGATADRAGGDAGRESNPESGRNKGRNKGRDKSRNKSRDKAGDKAGTPGRHSGDEALARGAIALANARHPDARIPPAPEIEARLWLPDPGDLHVLASAIAGRARGIITLNLKDFPRRTLGEHGLEALHPDSFLCALAAREPDAALRVALAVRDEAERLSGADWPLRRLLKKARLPRFAACLERLVP